MLARQLLSACTLREVRCGATICGPDSDAAGLVGLADGRLAMEIPAGPDDPVQFAVVTPGFVLSDLPVPPGLARPVAAVAASPSTILSATPRRLAALVAAHPEVAPAITRLVTINLWTTLGLLSMLRRQDNAERLASLLCLLAGNDLSDGLVLPLSQTELASMAALSRTTLVAALRDLEELGLVHTRYRLVRICNAAGLEAVARGTARILPERSHRRLAS
jgi:CRP/FNR family cyclic AMP-dependent transcriptional regulator